MDQVKIGKFIAECRKKNNLTQMQLAEKLNITDRAISKWENGKAMPDSSIMIDLCKELKINVNDLLSGEVIRTENYNENIENNLFEIIRQKEVAERKLLKLKFVIGYTAKLASLALFIIDFCIVMPNWLWILSTIIYILIFIIAGHCCIKIEQTVGYYECQKCHHKYIPTYSSLFNSMHFGLSVHMKCPKCNKKSWQKKVLSK